MVLRQAQHLFLVFLCLSLFVSLLLLSALSSSLSYVHALDVIPVRWCRSLVLWWRQREAVVHGWHTRTLV